MKRPLLALFAALATPPLLACCGIWDEASRQAIGQQCVELSSKLGPVGEGADKDRVQVVLDRCYVDANAGRFGIIDIATFAVKVEQAVTDGIITDTEATVIENAYDEMVEG